MEVATSIYNIDDKSYEPESDDGNVEYKYKLVNLDEKTIIKRTTQMKFRIIEGCGEAFYYIGIMDDGTPLGLTESEYAESVDNLTKIAKTLNCSVTKISESIKFNNSYIGEFLIREHNNDHYVDLKIGVAGNVDAGKSTTIGTLTKGVLDDGRGKARLHVFNFKHEVDTGRTSSIGHQIMGFNSKGEIVNAKFDRPPSWTDIIAESNKIVTFFDLAGHERYLRTTIYGLSSMYPDYCLIMIGANMGINHMTKEHMGLCLTLKIPFIIIVSKIDIVPPNVLEENMKKINTICKNGAKKIPYNIKTLSDVINVAKNIKSDNIVPIIQISNVSGHNLDLLKFLLNILPVRNDYAEFVNKPVEYLIDNTYSVLGHSTIVSGLLRSGTIKVNDSLAIGPFYDGSYRQCKVRSIHCKFKDIKEARAGTYICISLKNITRKEIKKGMVLVSDLTDCKISQTEFWASVSILHSPTTIRIGYQPYVHIDHVRQSVEITEIVKLASLSESNLIENKCKTETHTYNGSNSNSIDASTSKNKISPKRRKHKNKQSDQNSVINSTDYTDSGDYTDHNILRTGDKAYIKLKFSSKPEYIKPTMKLFFREGKVRAVGKIV
jgi:GTPase